MTNLFYILRNSDLFKSLLLEKRAALLFGLSEIPIYELFYTYIFKNIYVYKMGKYFY